MFIIIERLEKISHFGSLDDECVPDGNALPVDCTLTVNHQGSLFELFSKEQTS